jgi:hypothetical protein
MSACQSRTGIFTLKICGETAAASCTECGKPVCFKHYRLYQGAPYCVDCHAARDTGTSGDTTSESSDMEMERARRRHEAESTTGAMAYGDYDAADYETFDTTASSGLTDDDALPPDSFQDS